MPEYDGSAQGAPNPGVVDDNGNATLGGVIGQAWDSLSQAVQSALNVAGQLLGIPAANASNYPVLNSLGQPVGYLTLTGLTAGMPLAQALVRAGAAIDIASGRVLDRNGHQAGAVMMDSITTGGAPTVGPINIDSLTSEVTVNTAYGPATIASIPDGAALQSQTLDGFTLSRTTTPLWRANACSCLGVPILDGVNQNRLFQNPPQRAFLHPSLIGGVDGIYSLATGKRVVPAPDVGSAPAGFHLWNGATYASTPIALGWTSAGRSFCWWTGDYFRVIDPSTGTTPVIAGYVEIQVYDGSQAVSTKGYSWDYSPPPSSGNPAFNSTYEFGIGYSNYATNPTIFGQPQKDPGGPDGQAENQ